MPKLWNETIETHRRAVRDATLDAAAALATERGLASVTMSEVAEATGIGRATLYKYFPDVQSILLAWHERQIGNHLEYLARISKSAKASERLTAVLEAYGLILREHPTTDLAALLHRGEHVAHAQRHLTEFVRDLIVESVRSGDVRDDVAPGELAQFCLHALTAAASLHSKAAIRRLVQITLAGLQPPRRSR